MREVSLSPLTLSPRRIIIPTMRFTSFSCASAPLPTCSARYSPQCLQEKCTIQKCHITQQSRNIHKIIAALINNYIVNSSRFVRRTQRHSHKEVNWFQLIALPVNTTCSAEVTNFDPPKFLTIGDHKVHVAVERHERTHENAQVRDGNAHLKSHG